MTRIAAKADTPRDSLWTLDDSIISLDLGNGKGSAWSFHEGVYNSVVLPHGRVPVTGAKLSSDLGKAAKIDYVDWYEERYGIGEGVWDLATRYPVEAFQNSENRYGSEFHLFMALSLMAKLKVPSGKHVTVVVAAPPGLVSSVTKRIKDNFRMGETNAGDGKWTIALNGKKPLTYYIDRVIVLAEGQGAYAAYRFDVDGKTVEVWDAARRSDALAGRIFIVDLGYGTGDTYEIVNGRIASESIAHATDTMAGVSTHIATPIFDKVREMTGAQHITLAHADGWIRGWMKDARSYGKVTVSGRTLELTGYFDRVRERYGDWIIQSKLEPAWRQGVDAVLATGGGWVYIGDQVTKAYPRRSILLPHQYEHTKNLPLYDMNAPGQLCLVASNIRAHTPAR